MNSSELIGILRRNILTPVVLSIYVLAGILLFLHEYRDAWFMSFVITLNTIFAIVQEIRARRALHKLELMNAPFARIPQPDGTLKQVPYTDLTVGTTIELLPGDEVPADGEVIESRGLEVNESILTGESRSIEKPMKSTVLASSSVVAGTALVRVSAVGVDTKAGVMTSQLKQYRPELTPLQQILARLILWLTFGAMAVILFIWLAYWLAGYSTTVIFKTITSAGITIIPEGLILASTLLLAFGSLKLARANVLPQKLSAIEAMALLKVLCVDKTGTLTSDAIEFDRVEAFEDETDALQKKVGVAASLIGGGNATSDAITTALATAAHATALDTLAFSSERKLSAVRYRLDGQTHTIMLGAPEFVAAYAPISHTQKQLIERYASEGLRVLLVASFDDKKTPLKTLPQKSGLPLGLIILRNQLREGVKTTVSFLQKRGVSIRVISGDNPDTVRYIARSAGIINTDATITGADLEKLSKKQWDKTILNTTIFARVLPEQKEALIDTFKRHGLYTGMVGDGVNDALALKKADLGVAMFAGAAASRRVADIILLNNSFNSLPIGMRLGNRIMQAIELVSLLFFHKILYGLVVLFLTIALSLQYPFAPRHNTFMNIFMVSLPTLMWTFFPPQPLHRVNPKRFWQDTFWPILPISLISGAAVTAGYAYAMDILKLDYMTSGTIAVIMATAIAISLVFQSSRMLGVKITRRTASARLFYVVWASLVVFLAFGFQFSRSFFDFNHPASNRLHELWPILLVLAITLLVHYLFARLAGTRIRKDNTAM